MLITQTSNENTIILKIIHERIKLYAVFLYLDIEEQIENSFTNIDEMLQFAKGTRILISVDCKSRYKTWHGKINFHEEKYWRNIWQVEIFHIMNEEI